MKGQSRKILGLVHRMIPFMVLTTGLAAISGCNQNPSDQQIRDQAQQATEKARQQSKEALANARVAAANAEQKVNDIAAGVRAGMKGGAPSASSRVDLNNASAGDLAALPGISEAKARQIVRHRPYSAPHDLVERGLLTGAQYDAIAPDVTAH
jgi:DNA uptake protein ComE-like DNA-binding protein